ncbi:hypothetical protein RchiOBHm_Chr2g0086201 [Rosa chinensis]|uniref:Uncharacterized protein n=1 Tax=Rosa chinensis TaxID=74649 RepID=A0A2P6RIC4_ROSCH|nr:hypothetical protein RchiOBHm_Chr2g0086201 [Rosa chinensis]
MWTRNLGCPMKMMDRDVHHLPSRPCASILLIWIQGISQICIC